MQTKTYNWINYFSIFLILVSLLAWYYLFPTFMNIGGLWQINGLTQVRGVGTEKNQSAQQMGGFENHISPSLTLEKLYEIKPDAPQKNDDVGETYVRAKSAIVIDANSGTILYYQDGKRKTAIASLTKIMTAILVIENIEDLENEIVTIDKESVLTEGTKVGCPRSGHCVSTRLQVGEKISVRSLLDATLMNSANDAAIALGKHVAGEQKKFAQMMNSKAKELGLNDTNFCNPSGLDDDDNPGSCYSTAYDFARITLHSLQYDEIWEPMRTKEKDVSSIDGKYTHHLVNTDVLIDQLSNCVGGKTGFTYEAGRSLMMVAHHPQNKQHRVIAVLLDDNYRWEDMKNLFSWTFSSYVWPR